MITLLAGGAAGAFVPLSLTAKLGELQARIGEVQASLDASVTASADLQASLSVDPGAAIAASLAYAADAQAALALGAPALTAGLQAGLDAQLEVSASLNVELGALNAEIAALQLQLSALAGVLVYLYTGSVAAMGDEVGARVSTDLPGGTVIAPILVATSVASATAVRGVIGLP